MRRFLKSLILYFFAFLIGMLFLRVGLSLMYRDVFGIDLPPIGSPESVSLINGYMRQTHHVFFAACVAGLFGFFMLRNRALRRITLLMPIWAPLSYSLLYIVFTSI